ncbi:MAG: DUF523 and DUF1722 domain-containing protein [Candidatus Eisenbacteria bacterium]|uniref:DUF523 and DUF1722 domain-containing protein n=1 Tax=Eiseniibacteriota bacterium TaxID=2212470 RepID=A0A948WBI1_UNCEI|nr:DUF523 and DUF1722 domain-containing protein [Candidatus Eisenbacteria bacterium]MBU1950256.1 DUF523 and DUF1722 domain-containing protein [Candidatus Eisenbacteria bacterium]MBU2689978.1 DUF523 and DUF1722 domain-containing protein [Candidatus Eisenbacteria bacterium]
MNKETRDNNVSSGPGGEILIGISSCLLGEKVRFDGGHKHDRYITDILGPFVQFLPICPEVDIGLGTPRESLRLVRDGNEIRFLAPKSGLDHTIKMRKYAKEKVKELKKHSLLGYILKKDSPTCGMERVKLYDPNGRPSKNGVGFFAEALLEAFPLLPIEEEGRLRDAPLRENFVERIFAYRRMMTLFEGQWSIGDLVRFHTAEKLLLMAHDPESYRKLGALVAGAKSLPRREVLEGYQTTFMKALEKKATKGRHHNVLQHMAGYFKRTLSTEDKAELRSVFEDYRAGLTPLLVPVTLVRHHVRVQNVTYLQGQTYLEPHPKELMLRNHV